MKTPLKYLLAVSIFLVLLVPNFSHSNVKNKKFYGTYEVTGTTGNCSETWYFTIGKDKGRIGEGRYLYLPPNRASSKYQVLDRNGNMVSHTIKIRGSILKYSWVGQEGYEEGSVKLSFSSNKKKGKINGNISNGNPNVCQGEIKGNFYRATAITPATTKVLDNATMQNLSSVSPDGNVLTFSQSSTIQSLSPGDVIVSDVTPNTPNGLLRKVTSLHNVSSLVYSGSQIEVETEPATLEDAIQNGTIQVNRTLTLNDIDSAVALRAGVSVRRNPIQAQTFEGFYISIPLNNVVLYDDDGNLETTNDQVIASGNISFNPSFNFMMKIDDFHLKQLIFTNTTKEKAQLDIMTEVSILEINKTVEIARYNFSPITIWVGWLPVIITPVLTVNVGFDGNVSVGITAGITQEATLTAGVSYDNSEWNLINDFSNDFMANPPELSAEATLKAYAGPELELLIYGVVGPTASINGYVELDANVLENPWWQLYGGIYADVGVEIEILSNVIAGYHATVIDYRELLAQAEIQPGTISGIVKDAVSRSPLQGVAVDVYHQNLIIKSGITDSSGSYSLTVAPGNYSIKFSKPGYMSADYDNVTIESNTTKYLEAILQINSAYSGIGNISGKVVNALNGIGVSGLTLNLRSGINVTSGPIINTKTTQSDGSYSLPGVTAGNYTVEVCGNGYNTAYFTVISIGGTTTANQDATITPVLSSGETRIILTWGETPFDVDSHLTGPTPDSGRFHVCYWDKTYSYSESTYADLDLDDVTSYGPETTTVYQQINGTYRFSVHDYTDRDSANSYALSNSGAQVRVYRGSSMVANFYVPSNQAGTLWTVFEMSGNIITPINTMSYESNPVSVQMASFTKPTISDETDAPLMRNLPPKK